MSSNLRLVKGCLVATQLVPCYVLSSVSACSEPLRDEMAELPAVLVSVMVAGSSDGGRGLRLKDTSGEMPCEVSHKLYAANT